MPSLYYKSIIPKIIKYESIKIIMLHGLLGSSANLESSAMEISNSLGIPIILPDLPNHGKSLSALGIVSFSTWKDIYDPILSTFPCSSTNKFILFGHSFGGWLTMQLMMSDKWTDHIKAAIISDAAPRMPFSLSRLPFAIDKRIDNDNDNDTNKKENGINNEKHDNPIRKILSILSDPHPTKEAIEEKLAQIGLDDSIIMFIMRSSNFQFDHAQQKFKFIYPASVIKEGLNLLSSREFIDSSWKVLPSLPFLILKGEHSNYINEKDYETFRHWFPKSQMVTIPNAGHWIHFDAKEEFCKVIIKFIQNIISSK